MWSMFAYTFINKTDVELVIPFYYSLKNLGINEEFNFVFQHRDVFRLVKMLRLKTNLHLHEDESTSFLEAKLEKPSSFLYIAPFYKLAKNPIPMFKDALLNSEIVYYKNKNNYDFWGANFTEDFAFFKNAYILSEFDKFLEKTEGNTFVLPSADLLAT